MKFRSLTTLVFIALLSLYCLRAKKSPIDLSSSTGSAFAALVISNRTTPNTNNNSSTLPKFSISGTISNLLGQGLVIQNNSGDDLSIPYTATSFSFPTKASSYNITIKTQPPLLSCSVSNGTGNANADIINVTINCSPKALSFVGTTNSITASSPAFFQTHGVVSDLSGTNLYVADSGNHIIRRIHIPTNTVSTIAGSGVQGTINGIGLSAQFDNPQGITTDGTYLFISSPVDNYIRRLELATNTVTTIAGDGTNGWLDGTGTATKFNQPRGLATDGKNLYVADSANNRIRRIVIATNVVTTLAGSGTAGSLDGTGSAAQFNLPQGITTDGTVLYVSDTVGMKLRKVVINTGVVTTVISSGLTANYGIVLDSNNLYITDQDVIRRYNFSTNTLSLFAGSISGDQDGSFATARFQGPVHMTTDGTSIYFAEYVSNKIRKLQ